MMELRLWDKNEEEKFFRRALDIAAPEQLFYRTEDGRYVAYWPKNYRGRKSTLQSRNAFIGSYTEKWVKELLTPLAQELGFHVVQNVTCGEIGLDRRSPADVAIVRTESQEQNPEDIVLLIEVKMSIVWNWEYDPLNDTLAPIGDFTTHSGTPGLLRSDTMLKAIGKSINVRVSSHRASHIPIVVIGNTPITRSYFRKVDHLRKAGIIQKFYSVNPHPIDDGNGNSINIKRTPFEGFLRVDSVDELYESIRGLIEGNGEFFSSMIPKGELGRIIEIASRESTYEAKAELFLSLLRSFEDE